MCLTRQWSRYRKVYQATDFTLVGCEQMSQCFKQSLGATEEQMLYFGPEINKYYTDDRATVKAELKDKYGLQISWHYMYQLIEKIKQIIGY